MKVMLAPGASAPRRATEGAGAYDFYAYEEAYVPPWSSRPVRTGVSMEIPKGWVGLMLPRSSASLKGLLTCNVIDSDYRGEVRVIVHNGTEFGKHIVAGDRVAQMVVVQSMNEDIEVVSTLTETARGDRGFGSTGR